MDSLEHYYKAKKANYHYMEPLPPLPLIASALAVPLVVAPVAVVGGLALAGGALIGLAMLSILILPLVGLLLLLGDLRGRNKGKVSYPMSWSLGQLGGAWLFLPFLSPKSVPEQAPVKPDPKEFTLDSPELATTIMLFRPKIDIEPISHKKQRVASPDYKYEWSFTAKSEHQSGQRVQQASGIAKSFADAKLKAETAQLQFLVDKCEYVEWKIQQGALDEISLVELEAGL